MKKNTAIQPTSGSLSGKKPARVGPVSGLKKPDSGKKKDLAPAPVSHPNPTISPIPAKKAAPIAVPQQETKIPERSPAPAEKPFVSEPNSKTAPKPAPGIQAQAVELKTKASGGEKTPASKAIIKDKAIKQEQEKKAEPKKEPATGIAERAIAASAIIDEPAIAEKKINKTGETNNKESVAVNSTNEKTAAETEKSTAVPLPEKVSEKHSSAMAGRPAVKPDKIKRPVVKSASAAAPIRKRQIDPEASFALKYAFKLREMLELANKKRREKTEEHKEKILAFARKHNRIDNQDVRNITGLSRNRSRYYLCLLKKQDRLAQFGKNGPGVFYKPTR